MASYVWIVTGRDEWDEIDLETEAFLSEKDARTSAQTRFRDYLKKHHPDYTIDEHDLMFDCRTYFGRWHLYLGPVRDLCIMVEQVPLK